MQCGSQMTAIENQDNNAEFALGIRFGITEMPVFPPFPIENLNTNLKLATIPNG